MNNLHFSLNDAFKEMRKAGLIARQNFSCCGGCAGYEIATDVTRIIDKNPEKKNSIKGACFYHRQNNEDKVRGDNFYLHFGSIDTTKYGEVGLSTVSVGGLVCEILSMHHVPFRWNGKLEECIEIIQRDEG